MVDKFKEYAKSILCSKYPEDIVNLILEGIDLHDVDFLKDDWDVIIDLLVLDFQMGLPPKPNITFVNSDEMPPANNVSDEDRIKLLIKYGG